MKTYLTLCLGSGKVNELRKRFIREVKAATAPEVLVTVVQLPTGALEVITNHDKLASKIDYLLNAYDDNFVLKANPAVMIVGFVLA